MKHIIALTASLMLLAACGSSEQPAQDAHEHGEANHEEGHDDAAAGRTTIPAATAQSMGIVTSIAGAGRIKEQLSLSGTIQADPARVSRVRARYPGVVREVAVQPWANVSDGA